MCPKVEENILSQVVRIKSLGVILFKFSAFDRDRYVCLSGIKLVCTIVADLDHMWCLKTCRRLRTGPYRRVGTFFRVEEKFVLATCFVAELTGNHYDAMQSARLVKTSSI